jgi:hypothetical protein
MKKVFSILAITAMFAFASCGDKADNNDDAGSEEEQVDSTLDAAEHEMDSEPQAEETPDTTAANNDAETVEGGDADAEGDNAEGGDADAK